MGTSKTSFFGCIASLRGTHNLAVHTRTISIVAFRAPCATTQNSKLLEVPKC